MPMSAKLLRPANNFTPKSISGLALWLDASDASSLYTTDAGAVTPVTLPTEISECAIWLDGADATSMFDATSGGNAVAAGGTIARWQDKSGNGRHFVQAGSTLQPTLTASGRNGRSVVTFDATNDCMTSAATQNISQPATWIFAYKTPSSVASGWALVDSSVDRVHVYSASGSDVRMYTAGGSIVLEGGISADTWRIGTYHFNGASSQGRLNGVQSATGTTGTVAVNGTIYLASNGGATTFRGQMAEAILLTNASLADIARVEAYLAAKWGISGVHTPATATSDPVGAWLDKSGNARHATQSTAGSRPVVGSVNSRRALTFDGTDDCLSADIATTSLCSTAGGVAFYVAVPNNDSAWAAFTNSGPVGHIDRFSDGASYHGNFRNTRFSGINAGAYTTTGAQLIVSRANAATGLHTVRKDGATIYSAAEGIAGYRGLIATASVNVGSSVTALGPPITRAHFLAGSVPEVLCYSSPLTDSQVARIERYLAARWGITLAPQVSNADAQDWINRVYANGGTVSASTAAAVNQFCNDIEAASIRDRFYRLNLFCGGTSGTAVGLNSALVPLYRGQSLGGTQYGGTTDTNNAFATTDYSEASGLGPQATSSTTKYLDTGFAASSLAATRSFGVFIPAATYGGNNLYSYLGAASASGVNMIAMPIRDGGVVATDSASGSYNVTGVSYTLASGHYLNNTPSGAFSLRKTLRNGSVIGAGADGAATLGSQSIYVMAVNLNGAVSQRCPNGIYGYHFGLDMTSSQAEALRSAFNTFATAIGRPNV